MAVEVGLWSSESWSSAADIYLLEQSRRGSAEAYGELWRRHLPAAYAVANQHRGRASAEDIVAEASARVFSLIQEGKGPEEHFRAYFLTAVRTSAVDSARRDLRLVPTEDSDLDALLDPAPAEMAEEFDTDLIRAAFSGLSEQDQRLLWHTTVEGAAPRVVAPTLGMTANAVSARAMRAREALRARYLDACADRSVAAADSDECRWVIDHLGAHTRGRLPKRQNARVEEHLGSCDHAATISAELREIHANFPALIVPLLFAAGIATPGFVSAAAVSGLGAGASLTGAAGSATAGAGSAGTAGAGTHAAAGAPGTGGGSPSPADMMTQLASKATTLAAGIAIGAGVAAAFAAGEAPTPVAAPVPVVTSQPPVVQPPETPMPTPTPSTTTPPQPPAPVAPPPAVTTPPPAPRVSTTRPVATPPPAPRVTTTPLAPPVTTTRPAPVVTTTPPAPPVTTTPPTEPTVPPTTPPADPPVPPTTPPEPAAFPVTLSVVRGGPTASTFSLRMTVPPAGLTARVVSPAGTVLTGLNSAWRCSTVTATEMACTPGKGRLRLMVTGPTDLRTVTLEVTDADGVRQTRTFDLSS